jgi:hypothetical protein
MATGRAAYGLEAFLKSKKDEEHKRNRPILEEQN